MKKVSKDLIREEYVGKLMEALGKSEDVLRVGSGAFAFPVVDAEGEEGYVEISVKLPTGSRDGDPYDPWALAEEYKMKLTAAADKKEARARKAKEAAAKKAKAKTKKEED